MFNAWGKGKFDPRQNVDGLSKPVVIPPAYGLQGIHSVTFTGDGNDLAYWNRYVAVAEMGGLGTVVEPRLNLNLSHGTEDRVSGKLPALQAYQLSLPAPAAPAGSFDEAAAARGKLVFEGVGTCATCHSGPLFTDANDRLHALHAQRLHQPRPAFTVGRRSGGPAGVGGQPQQRFLDEPNHHAGVGAAAGPPAVGPPEWRAFSSRTA